MPPDPPTNASQGEEKVWEKMIDKHVKRMSLFEQNVKTLYSLIWGQCSDIMRQKVEAQVDLELSMPTTTDWDYYAPSKEWHTNSRVRKTQLSQFTRQ